MAKVLFLIKLYRIISTYELAVWLGFMVICYFITGVLISSKTADVGSTPATPAICKQPPIFGGFIIIRVDFMKNGIIVVGFATVGKTTLSKKYKNVIDLESSPYR